MAETTNISWCDATFNPWIGCTKVSNGPQGACVGCYAEAEAKRRGWAQWGDHPRHRTSEAYWRQPLTWNRKAEREGTRPFVFCASLADVFDNQIDPAWRLDLFDLIDATPNLVWLMLTKRPQNIIKMAEAMDLLNLVGGGWPGNAAIGCTVVTQDEADRDVPVLLAAKAELNPAFAFLSMEPLMGPVDLTALAPETARSGWYNALTGERHYQPVHADHGRGPGLDWVITGGETDQGAHKARPSHPDWFRSLREQCSAPGVAYHHKQNGEWLAADQGGHGDIGHGVRNGTVHVFDDQWAYRVGKKAAGRLLDGVLHDARPEIG